MEKPKKKRTTTTSNYDDGKKIIRCFHYECTNHHIANCKAKIVFSGKEAKNKDIKGVRRKDESGPSESGSVLREEE
jgi:hypothetical protein